MSRNNQPSRPRKTTIPPLTRVVGHDVTPWFQAVFLGTGSEAGIEPQDLAIVTAHHDGGPALRSDGPQLRPGTV